MITFKHIEDYLEVMGGYRPFTTGNSLGSATLFSTGPGPINLARYDVGVVQSMSGYTVNGGSLTDRQSELAIKIIDKYKKQFRSLGVDVEPSVSNPKFRNGIRVVDRSKTVFIRDGKIIARFPYDKNIISLFSSAAVSNKGYCRYNKESKEWQLSLTSYNINWIATIAENNQFALDAEIKFLSEQIKELEKETYKIELGYDQNNQLCITNAALSLLDYVQEHIGPIDDQQIIKYVDYSSILAYSVDTNILNSIKATVKDTVGGIILNRHCHYAKTDQVDRDQQLLNDLIEYLDLTERYPIYVYDPAVTGNLKKILPQYFPEHQIVDITGTRNNNYLDNPDIKCVYFSKIRKFMHHRIPFLLTTVSMMYGVEKQFLLQQAEKVVYYTPSTLDKEAVSIAS